MPDSVELFPQERRVAPRYEIMAQIQVKYGDVTHVMEVGNVSQSGIFVATSDMHQLARFRVGQELEMDLFTTDALENFRVAGRVARIADRSGHEPLGLGIRFIRVDDGTRRGIDRFVEIAAERRVSSLPPPLPSGGSPE